MGGGGGGGGGGGEKDIKLGLRDWGEVVGACCVLRRRLLKSYLIS